MTIAGASPRRDEETLMTHQISPEFISQIPKTDIHLHLDGSLRLGTLIELARSDGIDLPSYTEDGLLELVFKEKYRDLPDYLQGFAYTTAVMQRPETMERIAYELAVDNLEEGVRYIEVRFAPQLHIHEGFSAEDVVDAVCQGLERAKAEHNRSHAVRDGEDIPFEYGVILCALRYFNPDMSNYYRALFRLMPFAPEKSVFATASLDTARLADAMVHRRGLPVVGFDLAGAEAGFPAGDHKEAFQFAHQRFIRKTVHAGEAYGPESIFQAITDCYANRIGHGTFLFAADRIRDPSIANPQRYATELAEYIADRRITLEVCPTSNLQTLPTLKGLATHPLQQMIEHNLSVSICTDNRLMSNTTVTKELQLVVDALGLNRTALRHLIVAGFKGSFFPASYNQKRAYVRRAIDRYEFLERVHFGESAA